MLELDVMVAVHRLGAGLCHWLKRATRRRLKLCPRCRARLTKMLALQPGMDRLCHELAAQRDRQVRLQSVETDLALDLPPSIPLPDGEEIPYGSATRLQLRDPDQESEIYQKCIRPPPNRTVWDGESPPPYRSPSGLSGLGGLGGLPEWSSGACSSASSTGSTGSTGSSSGSTSSSTSGGSSGSGGTSCGSTPSLPSGGLVVRCHSLGGTSSKRPADILGRTVRCLSGKRCHQAALAPPAPPAPPVPPPCSEEPPPPPCVVVPSAAPPPCVAVPASRRCRRLSAFSDTASSLALCSLPTLPTVQCATPSAPSAPSAPPSRSRSLSVSDPAAPSAPSAPSVPSPPSAPRTSGMKELGTV